MDNLMEAADLAILTIVSISFALLMQWLALKGVFRLLQAPARDSGSREFVRPARKPGRPV